MLVSTGTACRRQFRIPLHKVPRELVEFAQYVPVSYRVPVIENNQTNMI
jgi:hypothetical protein